jgi:hypothetical protein
MNQRVNNTYVREKNILKLFHAIMKNMFIFLQIKIEMTLLVLKLFEKN